MTKAKKDWKFLLFASITVLVIYALINFPSYIAGQKPQLSPELYEEVKTDLVAMDVLGLREKLSLSQEDTLLFIYTSWCPHCRSAIPGILQYQDEGRLDSMQLIMLSIDRKPDQIIEYLGSQGYHKRFTPYIYSERMQGDMPRFVEEYGLAFEGAIPYAAIIDKNGKLIAQTTSGNGWDDIQSYLQRK